MGKPFLEHDTNIPWMERANPRAILLFPAWYKEWDENGQGGNPGISARIRNVLRSMSDRDLWRQYLTEKPVSSKPDDGDDGSTTSDMALESRDSSTDRSEFSDMSAEDLERALASNHCQDCGGLGIPPVTTNCNKVMCDNCEGLGVVGLEHRLHQKCIEILQKQKAYLHARNGVAAAAASGSIRRIETTIRREQDRNKELQDHFDINGSDVKILGSLNSIQALQDIKGVVRRCHNVPNQQYEVEIKNPKVEEVKKLQSFYKSENAKYAIGEDSHYVYVRREDLNKLRRRRLASVTRRRLPENYDALRPADQALIRRRLMNRQTSHIVVLEGLLDEINES